MKKLKVSTLFSMFISTCLLTFFSAVLVYSEVAMAYPKVGDKTVELRKEKKGFSSVESRVVLELVDYEQSTQRFKEIKTEISADGTEEVTETWQDQAHYLTPEDINSFLDNCESELIGGKTEVVRVPAGRFTTCKITDHGATVWVADLPFGVAKSRRPITGGTVESVLESYIAK